MAHTTLNHYLQQFDSSIQDQDGSKAAELLSFKDAHSANPRLQLENPETLVMRVLDSPYDELVSYHLKVVWAVNNHNFVEAYRLQTLIVQLFTKVLQTQKDENWALPIMYVICLDLRLFSNHMFAASTDLTKRAETLEKTAELMMGLFRVCASDNRSSPEDSKRKGMVILVNQLFKIYFKINKLHLCKPLIRAVESSTVKDQFDIGQMVTYRYYVGRKSMFDSDFKSADDYLTFSFQHCHKQCRKNKRQILIYLIPVKMLLGQMPKAELLQKYDLMQFNDIVGAVKEGNLMRLNNAMALHEAFFIKCGIYLILEKLKTITYRNLFKKVHLLLKTHQIPVESYLTALKFMGEVDVDLDEVEVIVSNLIYESKNQIQTAIIITEILSGVWLVSNARKREKSKATYRINIVS